MIGVVAVLIVQPGKESEFETIMSDLIKQVREKEPGVVYYDLFKHGEAPNAYSMVEKYENEEAFKFHGSTPYFLELGTKLEGILAQPPEFHILHQVI